MKTFEEFPMTPTTYKAIVVSGVSRPVPPPQVRATGLLPQGAGRQEVLRLVAEASSAQGAQCHHVSAPFTQALLTHPGPPLPSTQPLSPSKVETPVEPQWKVSSSF